FFLRAGPQGDLTGCLPGTQPRGGEDVESADTVACGGWAFAQRPEEFAQNDACRRERWPGPTIGRSSGGACTPAVRARAITNGSRGSSSTNPSARPSSCRTTVSSAIRGVPSSAYMTDQPQPSAVGSIVTCRPSV